MAVFLFEVTLENDINYSLTPGGGRGKTELSSSKHFTVYELSGSSNNAGWYVSNVDGSMVFCSTTLRRTKNNTTPTKISPKPTRTMVNHAGIILGPE